MKMGIGTDFLLLPRWYLPLSGFTLRTSFVKLRPEAIAALAAGAGGGEKIPLNSPVSKQVIRDLAAPMKEIPGQVFLSVDCCAPTDTERFTAKGGAVCSARSAWYYLTQSEKVAVAARAGAVEYICLRPYRNVNPVREFRLFIKDGELKAMSQYHLTRHFRRLEGVKTHYWHLAQKFFEQIAWLLEVDTLVMDIYITGDEKILIFDLNTWGDPTDPLLLRDWNRDWSTPVGIQLMAPPTAISGDVTVSF